MSIIFNSAGYVFYEHLVVDSVVVVVVAAAAIGWNAVTTFAAPLYSA